MVERSKITFVHPLFVTSDETVCIDTEKKIARVCKKHAPIRGNIHVVLDAPPMQEGDTALFHGVEMSI